MHRHTLSGSWYASLILQKREKLERSTVSSMHYLYKSLRFKTTHLVIGEW